MKENEKQIDVLQLLKASYVTCESADKFCVQELNYV